VLHVNYHLHKSKPNASIASFYLTDKQTAIKAKDITDVLRYTMTINFHCTDIPASETSARFLRGNLDVNNIRMTGHWYSYTMMR
jgi:hypothetical protein